MTNAQPFLSAGLPGLTFGLSLGRGLSIQLDPSGQVAADDAEMHCEEDHSLTKNVTIPTAMLVIHFHALNDLVISGFESSDDVIIYVTFAIASTKKGSKQKQYTTKHTSIVFEEIKYLPFVVNPKPNEHMNKFIVLVSACRSGEEHAVTKSKHKIVGRYEVQMHKLLKNVTMKENANLLNKKGIIVGQIELECCVTYGAFGYGQSYQLKTNIHSPEELVKMSLLPRIAAVEDSSIRGTVVQPRKLYHPKFIPLLNDPVEDLEPEISKTKGQSALECPVFPLLKQHMQRINQLRAVLVKQTTRTKRVCFLRKLLQEGGDIKIDDVEEASDEESNEKQAPVPPALALLMNVTKFFAEAPGIIRRRKESSRPSLPGKLFVPEPEPSTRRRSLNASPQDTKRDLDGMKDYIYSRRRQSLAPPFN